MWFVYLTSPKDIDKCENDVHSCDNATCENTIGGYICTCNLGFTGNGTTCEGDDNMCVNVIICKLFPCINM